MKNIDLECVPDWRFCNIPRGEKGPRSAGWQKTPLTLEQINQDGNVGVLLGPLSGGLCALDFDGASAWTWFEQTFNRTFHPTTICWSSGKDSRCQAAYYIPEQYWRYLRTHKIATGEAEGFEFRWTGCQSVLPPSLHPGTGYEYFWVAGPATTELEPIPEDILIYWLQLSNPERPPIEREDVDFSTVTDAKFNDLNSILTDLQKYYPTLTYDDWMRISFATASEIGNDAAGLLLNSLWPEQERGEYRRLLRGRDPGRSPTVRSLVYKLKSAKQNTIKQEINVIEKELKRRIKYGS